MELDRNRRVRETLERSESLLDQAQRLAKVGSWEVDLATDRVTASDELWRIFERTQEDFDRHGFSGDGRGPRAPRGPADRARGDRQTRGRARLLQYEVRHPPAPGVERLVERPGRGRSRTRTASCAGSAGRSRTSPSSAGRRPALATASAFREAASREHAIADELQRSLLPERSFDLEHLDVATYYRAGVEGTQVGGDWYDVIELGAGRSALVVGDVMGRGVSAAPGMGQLRSAVRAFAKLDLPPSEVLEYLDGMVQDLAGDQIVTCVYAVFDSTDQTLRYANAGHLPLMLARPGRAGREARGRRAAARRRVLRPGDRDRAAEPGVHGRVLHRRPGRAPGARHRHRHRGARRAARDARRHRGDRDARDPRRRAAARRS